MPSREIHRTGEKTRNLLLSAIQAPKDDRMTYSKSTPAWKMTLLITSRTRSKSSGRWPAAFAPWLLCLLAHGGAKRPFLPALRSGAGEEGEERGAVGEDGARERAARRCFRLSG